MSIEGEHPEFIEGKKPAQKIEPEKPNKELSPRFEQLMAENHLMEQSLIKEALENKNRKLLSALLACTIISTVDGKWELDHSKTDLGFKTMIEEKNKFLHELSDPEKREKFYGKMGKKLKTSAELTKIDQSNFQ